MPYRLLHTADLHLEAPFVGAGPTPREVTRRLAHAGLDTLDRLVALALERRVDAVLVAGGLLPSALPAPTTVARVRAALESLHAGAVATVLVGQPGEPLERLATHGPLPPTVTVVEGAHVGSVPVGPDGQAAVVMAASGLDGLARLADLAAHRGGPPAIGLCALPPPARDGPAPPALDHSPVRYWALGGRWPPSLRRLAGGGWEAMAGTPQLHGFVDPGLVTGVMLVEAAGEDGELAQAPTKLAVAAVEPVSVAVPLAEVARLDDLEERLVQLGAELVERSAGRLVVVRLVLEGAGRLRAALVDPATRARLLAALRRGAAPGPGGGEQSLCWWADLVLAPLPGAAAAPLMRTNRLADEAVRLGGRARAAAPDAVMAAAWAELDGRPGPAPPPGPIWAGVVMEATSVVLDLLDGERPCG